MEVVGIMLFGVGYALVDVIPVILPDAPTLLGLRFGAWVDFVLVFVLVALYVRLGRDAGLWRSGKLRIAFAAAVILMVQGHSVHLAADAIAAASGREAPAWELIYFLDEYWGHSELHLSFLIMAALFIGWSSPVMRGDQNEPLSLAERTNLLLMSIVYGLLIAGDAVEGQTWWLVLPAGLVLFVWGMWPRWAAGLGNSSPTLQSVHRTFFAMSFGIAGAALIIYRLALGDFSQLFGS